MTKIPLKDNQNAKKLSTDVCDEATTDDQDKDGFKFRCRNALKNRLCY